MMKEKQVRSKDGPNGRYERYPVEPILEPQQSVDPPLHVGNDLCFAEC